MAVNLKVDTAVRAWLLRDTLKFLALQACLLGVLAVTVVSRALRVDMEVLLALGVIHLPTFPMAVMAVLLAAAIQDTSGILST